nr:hypothetical protein [Candidatus Sigynarchaeota archaeon]
MPNSMVKYGDKDEDSGLSGMLCRRSRRQDASYDVDVVVRSKYFKNRKFAC